MNTDEYLAQLRAKPCECVSCIACHGTGSIDDPLDYSGRFPETCLDCDGSGLTEVCDRCMEIEDIERYE